MPLDARTLGTQQSLFGSLLDWLSQKATNPQPHPITQMMPSLLTMGKDIGNSFYNMADRTGQALGGRMYGPQDAGPMLQDTLNVTSMGGAPTAMPQNMFNNASSIGNRFGAGIDAFTNKLGIFNQNSQSNPLNAVLAAGGRGAAALKIAVDAAAKKPADIVKMPGQPLPAYADPGLQRGWKDGIKGGEWLGGPMTEADMTPKLIRQRIRQIEYDRRLAGRPDDGYPFHPELARLRALLKGQ